MVVTANQVVALLSDAHAAASTADKLARLNQIQELLLHSAPGLLDNFVDEILQFQLDPSADVRRFCVGFVEATAKKFPAQLPYALDALRYMIRADCTTSAELKRIVQCMTIVYGAALHLVAITTSDTIAQMWASLLAVTLDIVSFLPGAPPAPAPAPAEGEDEASVAAVAAVTAAALQAKVNDGVRTNAIKFVEMLVTTFSFQTSESTGATRARATSTGAEITSLDAVPLNHALLDVEQLRAEGARLFDLLALVTATEGVSTSNLLVACTSLATIARQRPRFMGRACTTLVHLTTPEAREFGQSALASLKKRLRTELLALMKHPSSAEWHMQLATGLNNLGAKRVEYEAFFRGAGAARKRTADEAGMDDRGALGGGAGDGNAAKRTRIDPLLLARIPLPIVVGLVMQYMMMLPDTMPADFSMRDIAPGSAVGDEEPTASVTSATTASAAGPPLSQQQQQLQDAADDLLEATATSATESLAASRDPRRARRDPRSRGSAPTAPTSTTTTDAAAAAAAAAAAPSDGMDVDMIKTEPGIDSNDVPVAVGPSLLVPAAAHALIPAASAVPHVSLRTKFELRAVPLAEEHNGHREMAVMAFQRLLDSAGRIGAPQARIGLLARLTAREFGSGVDTNDRWFAPLLLEHVLSDPAERLDLALTWLVAEHKQSCVAAEQLEGASVEEQERSALAAASYETCLQQLLESLMEDKELNRVLSRVLLECPSLTDGAFGVLEALCLDATTSHRGLTLLQDLIWDRPACRDDCLPMLLAFTVSDEDHVRNPAVQKTRMLYRKTLVQQKREGEDEHEEAKEEAAEAAEQAKEGGDVNDEMDVRVEGGAVEPKAAEARATIGGHNDGDDDDEERVCATNIGVQIEGHAREKLEALREREVEEWPETRIKMHLTPFQVLCLENPRLLHQLATVYAASPKKVKRVVHGQLETLIRTIGQASPALLALIGNPPEGSDFLILRILHSLTDKQAPTKRLVTVVKTLYAERTQDARFLIPILAGLEKSEILVALPKLISLPSNAVREVFVRLLSSTPQLPPGDLLFVLHSITPSDVAKEARDAWRMIIDATDQCFLHPAVFTHEVLAIVLQQLVDVQPLSILFMRTVMKSLEICPRLVSFVVSILSRLVKKKIWDRPKLWEGFVKCCQQNLPHTIPVLLQLNAKHLAKAFEDGGDRLREALVAHAHTLTPAQQEQQMSAGVRALLFGSAVSVVAQDKER